MRVSATNFIRLRLLICFREVGKTWSVHRPDISLTVLSAGVARNRGRGYMRQVADKARTPVVGGAQASQWMPRSDAMSGTKGC